VVFEFDMSMTWRETWYFLFAKKVCPKCSGPLERQIATHNEGFGWRQDGLDFDYGHKTKATVSYDCRHCTVSYPIGQLCSGQAA